MPKDIRQIDGYEIQDMRIGGYITAGKVMCPCGREVEVSGQNVVGTCEYCKRKFTLCADQVGFRVFEPASAVE